MLLLRVAMSMDVTGWSNSSNSMTLDEFGLLVEVAVLLRLMIEEEEEEEGMMFVGGVGSGCAAWTAFACLMSDAGLMKVLSHKTHLKLPRSFTITRIFSTYSQ